ncbi:hypothetical protein [Streptomyces hydrogenans]|uniref:hypothetical protein n=1 Tax=Streptomyces hydrogenans TaxID=1873719 RepID=UPI00382C9083
MTFTYTDRDNDSLLVTRWEAGGPGPVVGLIVERSNGKSAGCFIPLDRVEEVVAGIRDAARQTGQQPDETTEARIAQHAAALWSVQQPAPAAGLDASQPATDQARPPREQWRVEGYDAGEWNPLGLPENDRDTAVAKRAAWARRLPGVPTRLVRETTTWTVEDQAAETLAATDTEGADQ